MSLLFFGDCLLTDDKFTCVHLVKEYSYKKGIYYWFNDELNTSLFSQGINQGYDIIRMLKENESEESATKFFVTSEGQFYNSHELLSPFGRYDQSQLFPSGDDRTVFNKLNWENLEFFFDTIRYFMDVLKPIQFRAFITTNYDPEIPNAKVYGDIEEMLDDIHRESITSHMGLYNSLAYCIK